MMARGVIPVFLFCCTLAVVSFRVGETFIQRAEGSRAGYDDSEAVQREVRGTELEVDNHAHEHEEDTAMCAIDKTHLVESFNEVTIVLNITALDGQICSLPVPDCHHHDDEDNDDDHHDDKENGSGGAMSSNNTECYTLYDVCVELILHTNLTSLSCLSGECINDTGVNDDSTSNDRPSSAEAYGYGFLMVSLVSLGSLLGVLVVPLIGGDQLKKKKKTKSWRTLVYKYLYFFMIALGTSALLSDAILHLLPHAWDLHAHGDERGADVHDTTNDVIVEEFVWKGTIALFAAYLFFLLEFLLHGFTSHTHSHGFPTDTETDCVDGGDECIQLDTSVPHSACTGATGANILHPPAGGQDTSPTHSEQGMFTPEPNGHLSNSSDKAKKKGGLLNRFRQIKPLAWLIIIGDGFHNFADGLALGAAISQSLTLGVSTTIALIFHEIPHEFGDYVILLSTGLSWYTALLFNFASALTAVIGFFVGVAIGTESEEVNGWILAFAAGLFIYIALVDLLPELIHSKERGFHRWGLFLSANLGILLSFIVLFLLAVFEEDLNNIIS